MNVSEKLHFKIPFVPFYGHSSQSQIALKLYKSSFSTCKSTRTCFHDKIYDILSQAKFTLKIVKIIILAMKILRQPQLISFEKIDTHNRNFLIVH